MLADWMFFDRVWDMQVSEFTLALIVGSDQCMLPELFFVNPCKANITNTLCNLKHTRLVLVRITAKRLACVLRLRDTI
jgi:hypothetical protein